MIYTYDHLVPNKNKDDAHCSVFSHGNVFEFQTKRTFNLEAILSECIPVKSNMWDVVIFVVFFNLSSSVAVFYLQILSVSLSIIYDTLVHKTKMKQIIIERDAKRSHKNENENSIRQIKHKPKCPRELIILFYFVNRCFFYR